MIKRYKIFYWSSADNRLHALQNDGSYLFELEREAEEYLKNLSLHHEMEIILPVFVSKSLAKKETILIDKRMIWKSKD